MHGRDVPGNINMPLSVLTMGFWPTYQPVSAILPPDVNIFYHSAQVFLNFFFLLNLDLSITRNFY